MVYSRCHFCDLHNYKEEGSETNMKNFYGKKGVKKYCSVCGYYVYLCPDVKHVCPICHNEMEEVLMTEEYIKNERLELKQKLQQLVKEIPSCIDCECYWGDWAENGHCGLSEQQHVDSTRCLKDKFLNALPEKLGELLT
jgi:hypothetical protein